MNRFDKVAADWDSNTRRIRTAELIYKAIQSKIELTPNLKVADLGTGTGLLLRHFAPHVGEIHGFDNSQAMLKIFNEKMSEAGFQNVKTFLFDAEKDNFQDVDYHLFISSMSFHHITNIPDFLERIYSATAKNGKIALADLETEDGSFHTDMDDSIKHLGFEKSDFGKMLEDAGFKDVNVETIFDIEKETSLYPVFLATAVKY